MTALGFDFITYSMNWIRVCDRVTAVRRNKWSGRLPVHQLRDRWSADSSCPGRARSGSVARRGWYPAWAKHLSGQTIDTNSTRNGNAVAALLNNPKRAISYLYVRYILSQAFHVPHNTVPMYPNKPEYHIKSHEKYLSSTAIRYLEPVRQANFILIFLVSAALICGEGTLWLGANQTVIIGCSQCSRSVNISYGSKDPLLE